MNFSRLTALRRLVRRTVPMSLLTASLLAPAAWAADPPGSLALDWPLGRVDATQLIPGDDTRVMQNFGTPNSGHENRQHSALDLARNAGATIGATVYAAADGQVVCAPPLATLDYPGRVVVIEHTLNSGGKLYTMYGHLNNTLQVTVGQLVNRGMPIGTILSWTGPEGPSNSHTHFEVRTFLNWKTGGCWGPGYAEAGNTPLAQGWLNPITEYFNRRPAFPGNISVDVARPVMSAPNRNSTTIATIPANVHQKTDGVFSDQGGNGDWWHRVNYSGGSWGYTAGYWNLGFGGEIYSTDLIRYPGPTGLGDLAVAGGELYLFARSTDTHLRVARRSAAGVWGAWFDLEGNATSDPKAIVNADGRVQVFVRGIDHSIWSRRQTGVGSSSWEGWDPVGGTSDSAPAVAVNNDGRVQVFARFGDGALWTRVQTSAGAGWGTWTSLGGTLSWGPTAEKNSDGRIAVFVAGLNNELFQIVQSGANGAFVNGNYQPLAGATSSHPSAVRNADGRLELFVRGPAPYFDLRHLKQTSAGGAFETTWQSLAGVLTSQPRVAMNSDGRLEVFARGTDGALKNIYQTGAGGAWAAWSSLTGFLTAPPMVANQGGKLQVVVLGTPAQLYHKAQGTSGWADYVAIPAGSPYGPY